MDSSRLVIASLSRTIERYKRMQGYRYHTLKNFALRHVTCPSSATPPGGSNEPRQLGAFPPHRHDAHQLLHVTRGSKVPRRVVSARLVSVSRHPEPGKYVEGGRSRGGDRELRRLSRREHRQILDAAFAFSLDDPLRSVVPLSLNPLPPTSNTRDSAPILSSPSPT